MKVPCEFADLGRINGDLNTEKYRQILIGHAIPSGRRLIGLKFIPQQDNDFCSQCHFMWNDIFGVKKEQRVVEVKASSSSSPISLSPGLSGIA